LSLVAWIEGWCLLTLWSLLDILSFVLGFHGPLRIGRRIMVEWAFEQALATTCIVLLALIVTTTHLQPARTLIATVGTAFLVLTVALLLTSLVLAFLAITPHIPLLSSEVAMQF
ncbi:MAG TPA: hypothetical protein VE177_02815, partial [Candidatus Binatus sp.]|nr:hypothetical protein [Candidatus Binatus sp.]